MSKKSHNDEAWEKLFDKYDILNKVETNGYFEISAKQIKEFREPRLMTKFDHTINLPNLFAANKLSILPKTRGDYVISHFEAYHSFENFESGIIRFSLPEHLQSLDFTCITSEAVALNCAFASGMIAHFIEDEQLIPTVSGRMSSGSFDFQIWDTCKQRERKFQVDNSQIEIDAAYEGLQYLSLFEAKRDLSDDFLVRQLYYPYRTWYDRIQKEIKPIFLVYSNGIYRLYQYCFKELQNYNSLVLVKQQNYSIEDTVITIADIQEVAQKALADFVSEPTIPFPQANSFARIINLCELLNEKSMNREQVTENYDFDVRQTSYYTDAARYLGLVDKSKENGMPVYSLSSLAKGILKQGYKQRQLNFCSLILQHKIFADVLMQYLGTGVMPSNDEITSLMKQANLYNIKSDKTFERRLTTIKRWVEWIVGLVNE